MAFLEVGKFGVIATETVCKPREVRTWYIVNDVLVWRVVYGAVRAETGGAISGG